MQTPQQLRQHCLALTGAYEDFPFGEGIAVYKVMGKMFGIISDNGISLKCEPLLAQLLREKYDAVTPGYHLNKKHWNSIEINGTVPDDEMVELIEHSYELVVSKLRKADREKLQANND